MHFNITKVFDKKTKKEFLKTAKILYKNDKVWVCPLDKEINNIFDPAINTYYNHGEAERWILKDENNNLVGRIAAFIDYKTSKLYDQSTGGIGFFECINDKEAAFFLFDTAKQWLKEKGIEAMNGPINFGEPDGYWGLLVEGFTHPTYEVNYNHPYYQNLFESYGFKTFYKQEGFHFSLKENLKSRFMKIAEWVAKKPGYEFRHFSWKNQDKLVEDFAEAFNIAWASFKENFEPLKPEYIKNTIKKGKAIIDEEFIWLAYYKKKPIAVFLMYPDVNMILKHMNGKMNLWNMLKFLYLKNTKTITRARSVLMGVIPQFQNLGIESAMMWQVKQIFNRKTHYTEVEFSWVGDFNPKMRKIWVSIGAVPSKHYITYRYLFDRTLKYERYPIPEN